MTAPRRIDDESMRAWVGFLGAHARITQRLARDLDQAGQIPLGTYDVLVQLAEAGGALRHRDLLDRLMLLSQPGLSRRVERLEALGLVERKPDPKDGRGVIVRLSRGGRAALRSAAAVHMAGIHSYFAAVLSPEQARLMGDAFQSLIAHQAGPGSDDDPADAPLTRHSPSPLEPAGARPPTNQTVVAEAGSAEPVSADPGPAAERSTAAQA